MDNMPPNPEEKQNTTTRKKKKKKAYALSLTFLLIFLNKNKSSSPQVKNNLTSKFSCMTGREKSEVQHAFTTSADLVYFVIQTGIQKSNLNKTRLS